jgi:hypothetical protein
MTIACLTVGLGAILVCALPTGRYFARWLTDRAWRLAYRAVGLDVPRSSIDAEWRRKRGFDVTQARGTLAATFAEYGPDSQRVLRYAGLDPEHALVRPGNFDRTVLLPGTVFEPDDTGRAYRFRPGVQSIWVRNFTVKGPVKAYFQAPDAAELRALVGRTNAQVVEGSTQTTNSWGLRGPEPDTSAHYRGIALGDSYMQGLFVADSETPVECLKRELKKRLKAPVEILNTGHLGYSPEQYYYTLLEYAARFPPQFVVVSFFANDFGDFQEVIEGRGDWEESGYWLSRIREYCASRMAHCLFVPAPWLNQVDGQQKAGNYPGQASNVIHAQGVEFLDPIDDFADAFLKRQVAAARSREPVIGNPLFNGRIGDGHFSAPGCEVWASAVGLRLGLLIEQRETAQESYGRKLERQKAKTPTPRSP